MTSKYLATYRKRAVPIIGHRRVKSGGRLLPGPDGPEGNRLKRGWESQSMMAPSLLTRPADRAVSGNKEEPQPAGHILDSVNQVAEKNSVRRLKNDSATKFIPSGRKDTSIDAMLASESCKASFIYTK